KVFDKISSLESHPESGKRPQELVNLNYREVYVNPCRIFYKVDSDKVYIFHVMRQERDLRRFLLQS
ncbi:MAG: type II toxin-antitoxin system RelE/ParE family toxin, partial [Colwellia sp.]|nr:type II toxin-antitoxin system RelE/ParE family toxin [Colwellia sp.]